MGNREGKMLRIAVPDLISNSYFPIIAAVEMGFFKQEGFDASVDLLFPVPKTFEALRDGQLDFVVGSAHATLLAFPEWRGAKLLAAVGQHTYWFLVIRSDLNPKRGDLSIVKGLRIGAAPGVNLSLQRMLVEAGIDPEKNGVQIMPIPGAAGPNVSFGLSAAKALEEGKLDGFWANGMGCEVAIRRGVGTMVLDVRRGDGPVAARHYTFSALVATEKRIQEEPQSAIAAIRALMKAHKALREDVSRATEVGKKRFPPSEAELIAELVRRDLPYYDPVIPPEKVASMNRFAQDIGLLSSPAPYDRVVATQFSHLWSEPV
jgi:ABC-type nitrate/sulfonate/bicarbonate transport system substrate-binding protein